MGRTTRTVTEHIKPNFLFIGADRCGSKWLHKTFAEHPDCYVPKIADPNFFDHEYDRGLDWYFRLFEKSPSTAVAVGEFSHDYIHSPEAAGRISGDLPGVKLLATLRHPVERAYSDWSHSNAVGFIRDPFEDAVDKVPHLLANSRYADRLEPYFDRFDRSQIEIMLFDDLIADGRAFADRAFRFVGLEAVDGLNCEGVFNPYRVSRAGIGGKVAKALAVGLRSIGAVETLGKLRHLPSVRSLFFKRADVRRHPRLSPETRQRLLDDFAPQVDRLESILQVDLSSWRS